MQNSMVNLYILLESKEKEKEKEKNPHNPAGSFDKVKTVECILACVKFLKPLVLLSLHCQGYPVIENLDEFVRDITEDHLNVLRECATQSSFITTELYSENIESIESIADNFKMYHAIKEINVQDMLSKLTFVMNEREKMTHILEEVFKKKNGVLPAFDSTSECCPLLFCYQIAVDELIMELPSKNEKYVEIFVCQQKKWKTESKEMENREPGELEALLIFYQLFLKRMYWRFLRMEKASREMENSLEIICKEPQVFLTAGLLNSMSRQTVFVKCQQEDHVNLTSLRGAIDNVNTSRNAVANSLRLITPQESSNVSDTKDDSLINGIKEKLKALSNLITAETELTN